MESDELRLVGIYLDDHAAGAAGGVGLARRMARNNSRTDWGDRLFELADAIEEDERTLEEIRAALDIDGGAVKRAAAVAAERLGRLKPNGRLLGYSPLSRLLEAEGMLSGVAAKRRLWIALQRAAIPALASFDFDRLRRRAEEQLDQFSAFHEDAAWLALSNPGASTPHPPR